MPVDRPTFSESWYRVAQLRPRLRSTVEIHRQHYRGRMWYVLQDPSNNQFYRQNEAAYHFVALLDGRRSIGDVWEACNEELGDAAPTQGEAIQLLGQLYTSNLIQCELPPDAQGLFNRFQKRRNREVKGYLSNLLFIRVPLFDPDHFLDRWVKVFGKFFSTFGMILWMLVVATGLYHVISNFAGLMEASNNVLDPEGLPLLYLSFVFIKVIHEFGHAFACKKFGQLSGGGEVHTMGVMFLVFTPLPYVDASSSWAFRSKWHRVIVGAGGIIVELFVASIAAVVWANTTGIPHTIAYNIMFIASVSTLLFNANPLLRYDGYYILSDLIEIPNLSQRAKQYIYYLVRKYVWRVRNPRNPAHTNGERAWFVFYGLASTVYRVFICMRILMFVADKFFFIGFAMAIAAVVAWVCVPLGKFLHYLATSGELMRVRAWAVGSTAVTFASIIIGVGMIPAQDRQRLEGVVEPVSMEIVFAKTDGMVTEFLPNRVEVTAGEDVLIRQVNADLETELASLTAERNSRITARRQAETEGELVEVQKLTNQIAHDEERITYIREQIDGLVIRPDVSGTWVAPKVDRFEGAYLQRMDQIGMVADLSEVIIRCTAGQDQASILRREALDSGSLTAEIRVKGRPMDFLRGQAGVDDIVPGGQEQLPSAALGYGAGGSMATVPTDQHGMATLEKFMEIRLKPANGGQITRFDDDVEVPTGRYLQPGQRVVVRFDMPKKPLIVKWMRNLKQLVQRRFHI